MENISPSRMGPRSHLGRRQRSQHIAASVFSPPPRARVVGKLPAFWPLEQDTEPTTVTSDDCCREHQVLPRAHGDQSTEPIPKTEIL